MVQRTHILSRPTDLGGSPLSHSFLIRAQPQSPWQQTMRMMQWATAVTRWTRQRARRHDRSLQGRPGQRSHKVAVNKT